MRDALTHTAKVSRTARYETKTLQVVDSELEIGELKEMGDERCPPAVLEVGEKVLVELHDTDPVYKGVDHRCNHERAQDETEVEPDGHGIVIRISITCGSSRHIKSRNEGRIFWAMCLSRTPLSSTCVNKKVNIWYLFVIA